MKKVLLTLLALVLLVPSALLLISSMEEDTIEPSADNLVLKLDGNPSTGYHWEWMVTDATGSVSITSEYVVGWEPEKEGDLMPPGTGGTYYFTMTGITPGEATITFSYKRVWEDKEPLHTLVYRVRVDDKLNVTILSHSIDR